MSPSTLDNTQYPRKSKHAHERMAAKSLRGTIKSIDCNNHIITQYT
jgi:hypothetical protein